MPFEISVPEGSAPVTSWPHRINPILAKEVDATLNQFLAASLVQHWTSPYSSPLVAISKKSGGVRITHCVNYYMKLNKISSLSHLHIPREDQVLDSLGKRQVFPCSAWFLRSIRLPPTRIPFLSRRFGTPAGLYERLVMPQGSSASPVWCVKVIDDAIKDLEQVSAYLDDVIALDSDPMAHVKTMRTLFERLCKHNNLNFSPSNARPIGVTRGGPEEGPEGRPSYCKASSGTHMSGEWSTPRGCQARDSTPQRGE